MCRGVLGSGTQIILLTPRPLLRGVSTNLAPQRVLWTSTMGGCLEKASQKLLEEFALRPQACFLETAGWILS